jgi:copper chaperone CopZ
MKRILYPFIFSLVSFYPASAQFTKAELRADGLTCSLCSSATYKQLKTLDFIDSIGTDLDHATFILYFNEKKTVDFEKIRNKVEFAGFSVGLLKATYRFTNFPIDTAHCFNLQNSIFCFVKVPTETLNGETEFQIIDAGFVSKADFKKYAGLLAAHPDGIYMRVFHVIL